MNDTAIAPDFRATDRAFPAGLDRRPSLIGLDRDGIARALLDAGERSDKVKMRASQLFHWIYHRGARSFDEMTSISKAWRADLDDRFVIGRPEVTDYQESSDGTRKWLMRFGDGHEAETVHIPEEDRGALCVSSQVGCTLTCAFCHTGTQKLVRNLTAGEIIAQLMVARDTIGEWPTPKDGNRYISNIVMMGMGEPLLNYENVARALKIAMDGDGIAISKRRITLSTSGVVPMIERCGRELEVNLAISLHAVNDELRDVLVPINRKHPLRELMDACRTYPAANNARRITWEYVMLDGINDSPAEARELVRLIRGIPSKVNLIPFNPWPGAPYACSKPEAIRKFAEIVNDAGYSSPVRTPRGQDIMAACGQLKTASERERRQKTGVAG